MAGGLNTRAARHKDGQRELKAKKKEYKKVFGEDAEVNIDKKINKSRREDRL